MVSGDEGGEGAGGGWIPAYYNDIAMTVLCSNGGVVNDMIHSVTGLERRLHDVWTGHGGGVPHPGPQRHHAALLGVQPSGAGPSHSLSLPA